MRVVRYFFVVFKRKLPTIGWPRHTHHTLSLFLIKGSYTSFTSYYFKFFCTSKIKLQDRFTKFLTFSKIWMTFIMPAVSLVNMKSFFISYHVKKFCSSHEGVKFVFFCFFMRKSSRHNNFVPEQSDYKRDSLVFLFLRCHFSFLSRPMFACFSRLLNTTAT